MVFDFLSDEYRMFKRCIFVIDCVRKQDAIAAIRACKESPLRSIELACPDLARHQTENKFTVLATCPALSQAARVHRHSIC